MKVWYNETRFSENLNFSRLLNKNHENHILLKILSAPIGTDAKVGLALPLTPMQRYQSEISSPNFP